MKHTVLEVDIAVNFVELPVRGNQAFQLDELADLRTRVGPNQTIFG
jgi:hypothetical protein